MQNKREIKILITGANGLLGSQIAKKLVAEGHKVCALKRASSDLKLLGSYAEKIEWFEGDIRDIFSLENAMQNVTHLIHCAALISFFPEDENALMQTNVQGTANVMNAALEANVAKVLHVSSVAAFGRPKGVAVIDENLDVKDSKDNFNYYRSKFLGEREAWRAQAEGLNVIVINPSTILGEGNWDKEPNIAFSYAYKNYPFYTAGANGFVDVRDVSKIAVRLLLSDIDNEQFIVNSENIALREFQNLLADEFGKKRPFFKVGKWLMNLMWRAEWLLQKTTRKRPLLTRETAQLTQTVFNYSNEKIKSALNYSFIPVKESVREYCEAYLRERRVIVLAFFLALCIFSVLSFRAAAVPENDTLPVFEKNYFRSPLDIPLFLTGNFGEPRMSHFHSGLDIRTQGLEGLNVYAVADGYVSRINVSPYGYGNAVYITHPNGFVSVYAHLRNFNSAITGYLRQEQYRDKRFAENIILPPDFMVVKKGEIIANSGNTGGSAGPHLHFEIRDAQERIINPLHFGFAVADNVKPIINGIEVYPLEGDFLTKNKTPLRGKWENDIYSVAPQKVNSENVGIAINTYDKMTGTSNTYGIYSIVATNNNDTFFVYKADRFSFENSRQIISHLDYETFITSGFRAFHKCFVEPNNSLNEYSNLKNSGILKIDEKPHKIKIFVNDFAGNVSIAEFEISYSDTSKFFAANNLPYTILLDKDSLNEYQNDELKISIPAKALVHNTRLNIETKRDTSSKIYSQVLTLNKATEHLLSYYTLSLKTNVGADLEGKALIFWRNEKNAESAKGGDFENGFITAKVREFGTFYVKTDTTKPVVKPLSFSTQKPIGAQTKWSFIIKDDLSGIAGFNAYIDGIWTLAEFDAKYNVLNILNETKLSAGKHLLRLEVTDERQNTTIFETNFIY